MTQLHQAVSSNDVKGVLALLAGNFDVNARESRYNETTLGYLAALDEKFLPTNQVLELSKILIQAGADVNAANCNGDGPLHHAVFFHKIPLIEYLIASGADINLCNSMNLTPLHKITDQVPQPFITHSIMKDKMETQLQVAKILLLNKADVKVKTVYGKTPLNLAVHHNHYEIAKLLIDYGSDVDAIAFDDGTAPLHWACSLFNEKLIKLLLKKGANINVTDLGGRTPMMWSLAINRLYINQINNLELKQLRVLKILLKNNADVNTVDAAGNNILTIEPELDNECFKIIMEHMAKMSVLNLSIKPSLLKTIAKQKSLNNYFARCKKELLEAKNTRIHDYSVTYFDLYVNDKRRMMNYAGNKDLVERFEKSDYKKKYRIFAPYMQKNMAKAVMKRRLRDDAAMSLRECLPVNPTDLIIEKIISFLNELELQKLSE